MKSQQPALCKVLIPAVLPNDELSAYGLPYALFFYNLDFDERGNDYVEAFIYKRICYKGTPRQDL